VNVSTSERTSQSTKVKKANKRKERNCEKRERLRAKYLAKGREKKWETKNVNQVLYTEKQLTTSSDIYKVVHDFSFQ